MARQPKDIADITQSSDGMSCCHGSCAENVRDVPKRHRQSDVAHRTKHSRHPCRCTFRKSMVYRQAFAHVDVSLRISLECSFTPRLFYSAAHITWPVAIVTQVIHVNASVHATPYAPDKPYSTSASHHPMRAVNCRRVLTNNAQVADNHSRENRLPCQTTPLASLA